MAGKQCDGGTFNNVPVKNSKAYAEGRAVAVAGGADTDNPFDGLGYEEEACWDAGFASWTADPAGGPVTVGDCVAEPFGGGYVAP